MVFPRDVTPESRIPWSAGNTLRFPVLSLPPNYGTSHRSVLPTVPVRGEKRKEEWSVWLLPPPLFG